LRNQPQYLAMSNCNAPAKMARPPLSLAFVLNALPLLILTGCATQPFPNDWAQPQAALSPEGCSGLSGTYANGATEESAGLFHTLSRYPHTRTQADRVMLSMPDAGVLTVAAYNSGERVGELRFSEQEQTLACRPDGADIHTAGPWLKDSMWGYLEMTISLYKDKDGNLLAKNQESGVGVYGLIPMPGNMTSWHRFPRCISTPDKPCLYTEEQLAEMRAARAKRAKIHIYRSESFWAGPNTIAMDVDGRRFGYTAPGECVVLEVEPGTHELSAIGENTSTLSLTTETAQSYYVWQEIKVGWVKPRSQLHAVDEETGHRRFAGCGRVRSHF
jgi:hypothetical protein